MGEFLIDDRKCSSEVFIHIHVHCSCSHLFLRFIRHGDRLHDNMKSELAIMEKLGDSIMSELESAEQEVCSAWGKNRFFLY